MINWIIFLCGVILGITITILFMENHFLIKCPECKSKKPLKEIITFDSLDKREIKGKPCTQCEQEKKQKKETKIEIF